MKTKQEIFDEVLAHARKQKKNSVMTTRVNANTDRKMQLPNCVVLSEH